MKVHHKLLVVWFKSLDFTVYALLDPWAILSFVTPYVGMNVEIILEQLSKPFNVSTPVAEFILAERVYCDCAIFFSHKSTMNNLVELEMVDFDVILGMDRLHMIRVFEFTIYALLDLWASLSFVTPYVAMNFEISLEKLSKQFSVSILIGESNLA